MPGVALLPSLGRPETYSGVAVRPLAGMRIAGRSSPGAVGLGLAATLAALRDRSAEPGHLMGA